MKTSEIQIEVLEDGTVSIETDDLSGPNHVSADKLLEQLADVLGGPVQIKKKSKFHTHAHGHHHHSHEHHHG